MGREIGPNLTEIGSKLNNFSQRVFIGNGQVYSEDGKVELGNGNF